MKCERCKTENGYPKFREDVWICRKCLHKTPIKKEETIDEKQV